MNVRCLVATLGLLSVCTPVSADRWAEPSVKSYKDSSGTYRFTVKPRGVESHDQGRGTGAGEPSPSPQPPSDQALCLGRLERLEGESYVLVWERSLPNPVTPVMALVAPGGRAVVTLDDWYSTGFGDRVVVIYDATGALVRSYGLVDFMPKEIVERLWRSTSSVWWRKSAQIDGEHGVLTIRVYEPTADPFLDKSSATWDLRIALPSGEVLADFVAAHK